MITTGQKAAEVTGYPAYHDADQDLKKYYDKTDQQGDTAAVHQTGEYIHTVGIKSERVLF